MRNNPHNPLLISKLGKDPDCLPSCRIIQGTKSLIHEHGIQTDCTGRILDDIRKPQRHGKRSHERLPARQCLHIPHRITRHMIDIQIQSCLSLVCQILHIPAL